MLPLNTGQFPETFRRARKLQAAGRLVEARALYETLVQMAPDRVEVHFHLAAVVWQLGDETAAIEHLRQASALKPDDPMLRKALSDRLFAVGENDEALAINDEMIKAAPGDAGLRIDKAYKLQRLGAFDAAEEQLWRATKIDPLRGEPYRMLSRNKKMRPGDRLIGRMKKVLTHPRLDPAARVQIEFALAKAMEDTKQYGKVFTYLRPANAEMKKRYGYRISDRWDEVNGLIAAFSGFDFSTPPPAEGEFAPIFVTGLPRSGTTLVERILASHSTVTAGGELPFALRSAYQVIGSPGRGFTPMADLAPEDIARIGATYAEKVRHAVDFDRIVTDKAIQPHLIMGLLKQAIPTARFIVVRRDPRDCLYSIYKNMFVHNTHKYAYDLDDLASYYASFLRILEFWREAMPGGFHEVHYEDLVNDPEPQTRALVAASGLAWEDACLRSHESGGAVKTLSMQQVRQPIYKSSAQAWEKYAKDLKPLTDALEREGVL